VQLPSKPQLVINLKTAKAHPITGSRQVRLITSFAVPRPGRIGLTGETAVSLGPVGSHRCHVSPLGE
jgi:hypothetical protein